MKIRLASFLLSVFLLAPTARAAESALPPWVDLGADGFSHWQGLQKNADAAQLAVPGEALFRYPDGPRGSQKHGFRVLNDRTTDWHAYYGLAAEVKLPGGRPVELVVSLRPGVSSTVRISGTGWHAIALPWSAFTFEQARTSFLYNIKELKIATRFPGAGAAGQIELRNVRVVLAPSVALECEVRGQAAPRGGTAEYPVRISNCTNQAEEVSLSFLRYGWEVMAAEVEPAVVTLAPGTSGTCTVRVKVSDRVPPGGHESQNLQAVANGDAATASGLTFTTTSELAHPYVLHTPARWQEVKDKVKGYPWAKEAQDAFVKKAEEWVVPEVAKPPQNDPGDTMGPFLFRTQNEDDLLACGYSWQLTGNRAHAQKIADFLKRLSNPADGYPVTLRGCNQGLVQEGHFFQHIAMAYDMILDANLLSTAERNQIEATLRIFMETIDHESKGGSINNWNLSEVTGAFYCALAMQDLVAADRFFAGPGGIKDQLSKGTLDDGWWYECAISYNMWCSSEFSQVALAYEPFGIDFKHMWVPASYSPRIMLASELSGGTQPKTADRSQADKPFGMNSEVFGPDRRPYRTITDLWNGLLPFIDYRGIMFGVNDSTEREVSGQPYEIAYYVFRDPAYAAMIKLGHGQRDLLYGVPELPEATPELFRKSAHADNVGLAMLRSQTEQRPIREQIQATLHYGTHGWAHGHYDRTDLISLMRYGRSFWNPESVFYVYEPFMYKFYTQTSLNHNMVVVDEKMQEATPGTQLLFHTGRVMQATAVEATARWSYPPYGGMVYDYVPVKTFAEKTWREGRYVPIPEHPPAYGTLTSFTEPVLQRRLMVVTDDYVVLADYLKGTQPHTFESLLQLKGFQGLEAPGKTFLRHDAQWNPDPLNGAQFVTDCDWYSAQAPSISRFQERWGPGVDEEGSRSVGNVPGVLKLDVHTLWPKAQEIMVGTAPEQHDVEKRLYYTVRGDGKVLAEGKLGAWILGEAQVDVSLEGVKQLDLETKVELSKKPTVFWGDARVVTRDGKEIPLASLPVKYENVQQPKEAGKDYLGGPIKIAGLAYAAALPGQPADDKQPGRAHVDLSGVEAVRFKATLGSDYPLGDEAQRRKVYAVRAAKGTEARFLTLIEPYEDKPAVKSAQAIDADHIRVELNDGRVQEITLTKLDGPGQEVGASIRELRDGKVIRNEDTK